MEQNFSERATGIIKKIDGIHRIHLQIRKDTETIIKEYFANLETKYISLNDLYPKLRDFDSHPYMDDSCGMRCPIIGLGMNKYGIFARLDDGYYNNGYGGEDVYSDKWSNDDYIEVIEWFEEYLQKNV